MVIVVICIKVSKVLNSSILTEMNNSHAVAHLLCV